MSWYVLYCSPGREKQIAESLSRHLSEAVLEQAFYFQSQRLWKMGGVWRKIEKEMFPGYVFLQSCCPKQLLKELGQYRGMVRILEEFGYMIPVYEEEQEYLEQICGKRHLLSLSYGYKDKENGISHITEGPLAGFEDRIKKIDWHRRYAKIEVPVAGKNNIVWAGVGIAGRREEVF